MTAVRRVLGFLRRHRLLVAPVALVLVVLSAFGVRRYVLEPELAAIPFPVPVYEIEAVSGTHTASLLNLPIGQPGVLQAPMPVDVDGDLIPDVLVSVNLVDVAEVFNNPPELGAVIAPNVVIERFVKGVPLGKSPPLKINVKLTVKDLTGEEPDTVLRLGYDTGTAGSIPGSWKAVARGLDSLFNPLELAIDTKGGVVNTADTPFIYYEGPLNLIAGIEKGDFKADADIGYAPFPDSVRVTYASDDAGQHFEYAHGTGNEVHLTYGTDVNGSNVKYIPGDLPEVDLSTKLSIRDGAETTDVTAEVDRLPRRLALGLGTGGPHAGSAAYRASTDGRPPDARLHVRSAVPGERPLNASLTLDGLPSSLSADWSLPEDGPAAATFDASGAGLGAVEADIRNYDGESAAITPYASPEQQFLSLQQVGADEAGPDRWITGRVERIRHFRFSQTDNDGLEVDANVGDGEQPMLAHYLTDDRSGSDGSVLEGTATIAPMPDAAHVSVVKPATSTDDPLIVKYTASEAVDVDGHVEIRDAGAGPDCGDQGTLCASLGARHMPSEVTTTVRNLAHETHIDIDSTLRDGGAQPDFFVDAQMGQDDDVPLIAHAEVLGAPRYVRIFTHEGADQTLDRAEFHACDFDYTDNQCEDGTDEPEDEVGALELSLRNWYERPDDLPAHTSTTPSFFDIVARGGADPNDVRFEAVGRLTNIREVDYRNINGVAGVRTRVGGGNAFSAHADFGNIAFVPDDPVATMHRYDVLADVLVPALPSELDVCFRQAGTPVRTPSSTFVAPCEVANPFDDPPTLPPDPTEKPTAPLTFSYDANATFDVKTTGRVVDRGVGAANTTVADDHVIAATANVYDLPRELTLNVDAPPQGTVGPIRVLFDGDVADDDPQVSVDLDARQTDGDLVCADPRVPATGDQAMCVRAGLRNLPETALVTYDPAKPADNLHVLTTGGQVMDIVGFGNEPEAELSIVKRHEPTIKIKVGTGIKNPLPGIKLRGASADVLIARGRIMGLPREINGTLRLPSAVDIQADPPLRLVDLTIQNFIAPDPMPSSLPGKRLDVPDADQNVTYLQRGDHFRADIEVGDLRGAAFASAVDATGKELDTKTMSVDFGPGNTVRAYADLLTVDEESPTGGLKQVIADITLPDMPEGMSLCFRGPKAANAPAPVQPTYCDSSAVAPSEGAFSVATDPGADANELDVHAFVRVAKDGGAEVTAARLDVTNVPRVVQGTFDENGKIVFGGFANADAQGIGQDPDGIDQITFDFADFDADGLSGFEVDPWEFGHSSDIVSFPDAPAGQNIRLRVTDTAVRAAGTIGDVGATGNLQALLFDKVVCPAPENPPADYATYYADAVPDADYTCIRAVFDPGGTPSPVLADIVVEKDGKRIAFHDGGFSRIPDWVQITMASVEPTHAGDPFVTPCGPAYVPSNTANCLPPMIRLDTKSDATLAGVLELGSVGDLKSLNGVSANDPIVDLKAVPPLVLPGPNAWSDWVSASNPGAHGARLRMATFKAGSDSRIALRAGLRLAVPKSFTLDQVQTWDAAGPEPVTEDRGDEAKDIKLHYTVRDGSGAVLTTIGEAAALIRLDGGKEILLSGDDPANIRGFDIPGDLALDVYLRHHKRPDKNEDTDPKDRLFAQIDGRVNKSISARLRVSGEGMRIDALVKNVPALPAFQPGDASNGPSFRLRFEMDDDRKKSSIPDGGFLCFILCIQKSVAVETVDAVFDFANNGHPDNARRVDAFVDMAAPRVGMDVRAFENIDPAVDPADDIPAEISGKASAHLEPLDVLIHAEFLVAGANMVMVSDLRAGADINQANRFRVTSNLLHLKASAQGSGESKIATQFSPQLLAGELHSPFGIFIGDPILYWFLFAPPVPPDSSPPLAANISFAPCPIPAVVEYINDVPVPGDGSTQNLYAWLKKPFEPRFHSGGALTRFFLDKLIGPLFCLADADLINGVPRPPFTITSHPVPPVALPPAQVPTPPVEPPPPPPLTVAADRTMCGEHTFESVTIAAGASLQVADTAGPDCAAGDVGTLRLKAIGAVTINGTLRAAPGSSGSMVVSADSIRVTSGGRVFGTQGRVDLLAVGDLNIDSGAAVNAAGTSAGTVGGSAATGANGAGHGGAGGLSGPARLDPPPPSFGTPGTVYGDDSYERIDGFVPGEAGSASAAAGRSGGGVVQLVGDHINVAGLVTVAASPAPFILLNAQDCAVPGDDGKPNTGSVGTGGGSGGTVVLAGHIVDLTGGQVLAHGGQGGAGTAGGGGGGGGGVAKVITPVLIGAPDVTGGGGGANGCPGDAGIAAGANGTNGKLIRDPEPVSRVVAEDRFWFGNGFGVDVQAAGQPTPEHPTFSVMLCGTWRPPQTADDDDADLYDLDMPTSNSPGAPCGSNDGPGSIVGDSVVRELRRTTFTAPEELLTVSPPGLAEGYWGLYSIATTCTGPGPFPTCTVESLPAQPDRIVGIDNTRPDLTISLPGVEDERTKDQFVTLDINAPTDTMSRYQAIDELFGPQIVPMSGERVPVSGTDQIECSNDAITWLPCVVGTQLWQLTAGSGPKTVFVQAVDKAGNLNVGGVQSVDVELDVTPPSSSAKFDDPMAPNGLNGWFVTSPVFEIYGYDDHGAPLPPTGQPRYRWWIDSGSATEGTVGECNIDCLIHTDLSDGVHTFNWQGVDALENAETPHTITFRVDRNHPRSALLSSPRTPDGANGWFVTNPWIVVSAVDPPGGSGLVNHALDPSKTAGILYQVKTEGQPDGPILGPIAPRDFVPFQLGQGSHDVCWQVTDRAGRQDNMVFGVQCQHYDVDLADPMTILTPIGTPGDNGWFTSLLSVGHVGFDTGSGVDPLFDPGAIDLCSPLAGEDGTTPSGVCVSVDDGSYLDRAGNPDIIGEGLHTVRAYSVDVSGRRSRIAELPLQVDRSHPVSSIRTMPAAPASKGWWRTSPTVVLRAGDGTQNAGVSAVRYRLDGGPWTTYTSPFKIPEGIHSVDYQSVDRSGANAEAPRTLSVPVDLTSPVAKALNPSPVIWSKLLGNLGFMPAKAKLNFQVSDNLSRKVHVYVIVYDTLGAAARRIDGGIRDVTPGVTYNGFVEWDGRDQSLTGFVGIGLYHYRVIAIDEAGNRTQTGESKPIQIKVL